MRGSDLLKSNTILGVIAILAAAIVLAIVYDPAIQSDGKYHGAITATYPTGKNANGFATILVKLDNGALVKATISNDGKFPYADGTPVDLTGYDTLLLHRRSYVAHFTSR
jgi:hypothetical protein